jgi:hypothetical protein
MSVRDYSNLLEVAARALARVLAVWSILYTTSEISRAGDQPDHLGCTIQVVWRCLPAEASGEGWVLAPRSRPPSVEGLPTSCIT